MIDEGQTVPEDFTLSVPDAGTADVTVMVGKTAHALKADLSLFEDAEWMHDFLALAETLRKMRIERGEDFEALSDFVEGTRELHPQVVGMVEDVFGGGVYETLFGATRKPMARGMMLLVQLEPLIARAYDSMFAGWVPEK